ANFRPADRSVGDVRFAVFFPAVKMPNVGEVVDQPPADVVTCRGVPAARLSQADDDLQRLSNNDFLDSSSPSPSSSAGPLPMTSGSAAPSTAPSTPSAAGVSSITAR